MKGGFPLCGRRGRSAFAAAIVASLSLVSGRAAPGSQTAPPAAQGTVPPVQATPAAAPKLPDVTYDDLLAGFRQQGRWLTYSGDYSGRRHSPLTQITPANVRRLAAQWTFQAEGMPLGRGFQTNPLVHDGVMYVTGNSNMAWALDARTGRQIWRHRRQLPAGLTYGGGNNTNRGFAILGDRLFMGTLDAHLVALDRNTGAVLWDVVLDDFKLGHAATVAPLVVKDKVIVGNSGGDFPTRGFIDAYDAKTGRRVWRFYTVPAPGEPGSETWSSQEVLARGGGAAWQTGSYDPELNLIYWGTGNPNPDYYGEDRKGDNLYTASLVALDADTGTLRWHYQFTPHDTHDWDSNHVPVLADLNLRGRQRKVVMVANRNGFFYTLDRTSGELLVAKPFTGTQWAREIGPDSRPIVLSLGLESEGPDKPCVPDFRGGTNFNPPSFDPALQLFFVMARETCAFYTPQKQEVQPGRLFMSGGMKRLNEPDHGPLRAIDPRTGDIKWEYTTPSPALTGVLSTASGLVFAGDGDGNLNAFDSKTGRRLWFFPTGSPIHGAAPITYMLDGRQWVVIPSGTILLAFALPAEK